MSKSPVHHQDIDAFAVKQHGQLIKNSKVKNESTFPNDPTGNFISTFSIENKDVEHLFSQIEDLTKDWQERYINFHLLDGGS